MRELLDELNTVPGVRGSAVVMTDGVVVASALSASSDADSFAALASSLLCNISKNLSKLELGRMRRAMVTATRGRFCMIDLGGAWLVAELDREIDASQFDLEIESAAGRVRRRLRVRTESAPAAAALPFASHN